MSNNMNNNSPKNKATWAEPIAHGAMHTVHITSSPASQYKQVSKLRSFGVNTCKKEPSSKALVGSPDSFIDLVKAIVPTQPRKLSRNLPSPPPSAVPPNTPSKESVRFSLSPSSKRPNKLRMKSGGGRPTPSLPPRPPPNIPSKKPAGVEVSAEDVLHMLSGGVRPTPLPPPRPSHSIPSKAVSHANQVSLFLRGGDGGMGRLLMSTHFDLGLDDLREPRERAEFVTGLGRGHFPKMNEGLTPSIIQGPKTGSRNVSYKATKEVEMVRAAREAIGDSAPAVKSCNEQENKVPLITPGVWPPKSAPKPKPPKLAATTTFVPHILSPLPDSGVPYPYPTPSGGSSPAREPYRRPATGNEEWKAWGIPGVGIQVLAPSTSTTTQHGKGKGKREKSLTPSNGTPDRELTFNSNNPVLQPGAPRPGKGPHGRGGRRQIVLGVGVNVAKEIRTDGGLCWSRKEVQLIGDEELDLHQDFLEEKELGISKRP